MAVVVEIRPTGAPAPAALANAGEGRHVHEPVLAPDIQIEAVSRRFAPGSPLGLVNAGDEPVQVAVPVEVDDGAAHCVLVGEDMAGEVGETGPALVSEDLTGETEIAGQQEVGIAVRVDIGERRREGQLSLRIRARDKARANRHELADILKAAAAVVAPQIVRRRFEGPVPAAEPVGEEQVEVAVAVVVGRRHRVSVSPVRNAQAITGLGAGENRPVPSLRNACGPFGWMETKSV